jgi:3-hydroxyisobutyrate dehydrogenase-like beta-hydroxyacid dehydrogenase
MGEERGRRASVGFIGLGIMGSGMARNLLKAGTEGRPGLDLIVWNRTVTKPDGRRPAESLIREGAKLASTPADLAAQCEVIFLCVSDTPDVKAVLFGENGVVHGVQSGSLVVDCSTISPIRTQAFARALAEKGVHMLDAPVSGGSEGAAKGTLSIMVGGEADQVARAMPYLQAMGKNITHVGGNGAGQMVKLVNQILVANSMLALGEAFLFAQAGGLDLEKTLRAIEGGAAGSWTLSNRGPQLIQRDWRPGFMIDLQQKDLRLILEAADEYGVPVFGSSLAFHLYRTLQSLGCGAEGNHALVKALENLSGIQVGASAEPD